jgi:hypothetical protein
VLARISICTGDAPLLPHSSRAFAIIPPNTSGIDNPSAVHIVQMNSSVNTCAEGTSIIYITTQISDTLHSDSLMEKIVTFLHELKHFKEIFSVVFTRPIVDELKIRSPQLPINLILCGVERYSLNFQNSVENARTLFARMYPDEVFMSPIKTNSSSQSPESEEDDMLCAALGILEATDKSTQQENAKTPPPSESNDAIDYAEVISVLNEK